MEPRPVRIGLRIFSFGVMAFLYIPLVVIVMASFNASRIPTWPIKDYTLHWFDTFGSPPGAPGTGQWENDTLKFHQEGSGNTIFELAGGGLIFKIEMPVEGKGFKPIVEGKYRRVGSGAKVSEEDQPELDRMTSRS